MNDEIEVLPGQADVLDLLTELQPESESMTEPITITIPAPFIKAVRKRKTGKLVRRSPWLNANDRDHWRTTSPIVKAWRSNAEKAARAAGLPLGLARIRIDGLVVKPRGGRYDAMNFYPTAKACVDGLVDYGLVEDDSNKFVEGPFLLPGDKGLDALILTVTAETLAPSPTD